MNSFSAAIDLAGIRIDSDYAVEAYASLNDKELDAILVRIIEQANRVLAWIENGTPEVW